MVKFIDSLIQNLPRTPSKEERAARKEMTTNPFKLFASLTWMQQAQFWVAWLAWTADAYDFFCVSLTTNLLSTYFFGEVNAANTHTVTTSITYTLLLRSVGALSLGILSDRYGRKWPLIANLICIVVLQIGTSFCTTWNAFVGVRAVFGLFMGGIWGVCTANALESIPTEARGLFSGLLQQGYAVGYLVAAVVNLYAVPAQNDRWQIMFYIGAGITAFAAIARFMLPESAVFARAKAEAKARGDSGHSDNKAFFRSVKDAASLYWLRFVYAIVLMAFFNFFSHGSQDLYPTYVRNAKGLTAHQSSVATIIGNCGAIAGGLIMGWLSQFTGRRLTIIGCCLFTGAFIPLWILPNGFSGLAAGAFFIQVGVQGAWSVIPVYLNEIAPPAFRALFSGLSYQLGNAASSASAQLEATAGESWRTTGVNGTNVPDYAKIMALLIGLVALCIIGCMLVGPESCGSNFEQAVTAKEGGGAVKAGGYPGQRRMQEQDEEKYNTKEVSEKQFEERRS